MQMNYFEWLARTMKNVFKKAYFYFFKLYTIDIVIWNRYRKYAIVDPFDDTVVTFGASCPTLATTWTVEEYTSEVNGTLVYTFRKRDTDRYIYRAGNDIRLGNPSDLKDKQWQIAPAPNGPVHGLTIPVPLDEVPCYYWTCDIDDKLILGPPQGGSYWNQIFEWKAIFFYQGPSAKQRMPCPMSV
ncbi:hypothetical protein NP233_g3288 [Leucocoprinus birnbaumii]|uniref:Uncharacterized protein n=1 Tax=Leucocoprinus birnbaumii TaxID=56174 RepID=A0AAD5VXG9_9AGAR|nr:hypothetical protein NP233_g3288 [Leucocoprinus birnbaumii]